MYTHCPECNKQRIIYADELRESHGMICCESCSSMYDALELLSETAVTDIPSIEHEFSDIQEPIEKKSLPWTLGYSFFLVLLIFQVYFFEGYRLTQNALIRPWLEKTCQLFECQLPDYHNLEELSILHGSFESAETGYYLFKTAFTNEGYFEQNYPAIKLTLQNYNGQTFAERIFQPFQYTQSFASLIQPDMTVEISMDIAEPLEKIGGYRFELIK